MFTRLALAVSSLLLAACSAVPAAAPTATPAQSGPSALSVAVASNDFPVGITRVPLVLFIGAEPVTDAQAVSVTAYDLGSGTPVPGWSGAAQSYSDYTIPYWVVYPNLPTAGYWGLGVVVTLADGTEQPASLTIQTVADPSAPALGEVPPASENRTTATEPNLALLTSDPSPDPALYTTTVADALASGKPTVVTFATPAFCTSRLCAPVVDTVKTVHAAHPDQANYIHIEVFADFETFTYTPEMEAWGIPSEPWTFVLDAHGRVVGRFGGPVSPAELEAALVPLLS
jgi:hypothetical protein